MASKTAPSIQERALTLLKDSDFFGKLREAVKRGGLVGEVRNALAIYVIAISSLLDRPLNAIVKGVSSAGKNLLVSRALLLIPKTAIEEITSSSRLAWTYSRDQLRHRIVYLKERNDDAGVESMRLLISEGELTRTVTVRRGSEMTVQTFVAKGPIAAISTTTEKQLRIDEETRHVSLWVDESEEQTLNILERQAAPLPELGGDEIKAWHEVYGLVSKRSSVPVELPEWFKGVASRVSANNIRVRRYFPAFLSAVRTIALLRSFKQHPEDYEAGEKITAKFADYAIAAFIFDGIFVESLNAGSDECIETRTAVEKISSDESGKPVKPVDADQLSEYMKISYYKANAKLRSASGAGAIVQANKPERNNRKRYLPSKSTRFVPDPKEVFAELSTTKKPVEVVHPLTGKTVNFTK
jgi:hypothetical protein